MISDGLLDYELFPSLLCPFLIISLFPAHKRVSRLWLISKYTLNECVYEYVRPKISFRFFHKTLQKNFWANPIYAYENVGFLQENEMTMFHLGTLVDTSKSLRIKLFPLPQFIS